MTPGLDLGLGSDDTSPQHGAAAWAEAATTGCRAWLPQPLLCTHGGMGDGLLPGICPPGSWHPRFVLASQDRRAGN